MNEIFKQIKNYEGLYSISNFGKVRSELKSWHINNHKESSLLKIAKSDNGYYQANLRKNGKKKTVAVHVLVWDHFGKNLRNGRILQIDHIDNNKENNRIDNLQLCTARQNVSKDKKLHKKTSRYIGVSWHKGGRKWEAKIMIEGKQKHLGSFSNEHDAHLVYQKKLRSL